MTRCALAAYRGVTTIGGLCLAAEVFDWRRFPSARPFMSFTGLVPSERSTGKSEHRGSITRAGNAHLRGQLCEAAWAYQHSPSIGTAIQQRQRRSSRDARPLMDRPGPSLFSVPPAVFAQERALGRRRGDSPRARRVLVGRDGGRGLSVLLVGHGAIGAVVTEFSTTRRSTAAADLTLAGVIPSSPPKRTVTGAPIQRQQPAYGSTAIPTREHHRGGYPIHCAPARRRALGRPPPGSRGS